MSDDETREFVGESQDDAAQRAADHFGVPKEQISVRVVSDQLQVSGLGNRVLILASVSEGETNLGPVGEFVRGVLSRMELSGRIRAQEEVEEDGSIVVRLSGAATRDLTRNDARAVGALSHLATRAAQKHGDIEARARVEAGGVENPADEKLEALARAKGDEVLQKGKPIELEPMGSRERWVVHNALKEQDGLRTESVGEGRAKRVRIDPA